MTMGWKSYLFGDLIDVKHGWAFKSEYFSQEGSQIVLTPGNFFEEGGFKSRGAKDRYYLGDYPEEYLLKKGDVVVAMTEQGAGLLGSAAVVPGNDRYLHNQRLGRISVKDESLADLSFVYRLFNSEYVRMQISGSASGAKVRHTAPERIYRCKVKVPPIATQQKITRILSAYDDLVENNLKRIKLLEEMAQITYEQWFVRMKFPGYETIHIDPETGLPEGWRKMRLDEVCYLTMGQSPKSDYYNEEENGLPFHQGVKDYGFRFPQNRTWSTKGVRVAEKRDVLFSVRAPVGRLNVALETMIIGRGLASIRSKGEGQSFLFYQLQKIFFSEDMMGGGAIFNSVTKNDMGRIELLKPDKLTLFAYEDLASSIDRGIENLFKQNLALKEARDILLPRLMTGLIDVDKVKLPDETAIWKDRDITQESPRGKAWR